jgi:hypothetical protein
MLKTLRLKEHIEWAFKEGFLDEIYKFLLSLNQEEWHHRSD